MAYFTPYAGTGDASLTAALSPASGITILPGSIALTYQVLDGQGGATSAKQMFVVLPKLDQEATGSLAISGTVQEGATITADTTGITDADGSFSTAFQWQLRNDSGSAWTDIAGAAAATLAIPGDQSYVGRGLRVTAITTDALGGTTAFTSAPQTVANVNDAPIGGVAIGGTVAEGQTLTASSSIIDEDGLDPATILYRWQADGADLPAATGASVLLAAADAGKAITVVASYVDAMGTPEQVTSDAVGFGLTLSGTRRADLLTGGARGESLRGNDAANLLDGGAGDDVLAGGYGSDTLTGGAGADRFVFDTALQARKNVDTLFDFDHADDTIELSHLIFGQSGKLGAIDADQLAIGPAATLPSHRIVYDSQAGTLAYDADGSLPGAAVVFATLVGAPSLDASDFFVV